MTLFIFFFNFELARASEITSENIINVVNKEREARDIDPLSADDKLQNAAKLKSTDMIVRNYFEHYAYSLTPWSFILGQDYRYSIAGENLAMGFNTSEGVVSAWMNSPAHRENILNPEFEDIGVGVVKGEFNDNGKEINTTITTEMLAKPKPKIETLIEKISQKIKSLL